MATFKAVARRPRADGFYSVYIRATHRRQTLFIKTDKILDDLFLVQLDAKERPILLDIIEDRHERKSIIITSQYPSSSWYDMVGDPTVADAILDRIVHSAHYIELTGENMRKLKAKKA